VIPCHNYARYLARAIESVLGQTRPATEVIVVDDGSTDETVSVAAGYDVVCISQPQQGVSGASNSGLAAAGGDYVLYLDADDELVPDALETLAACADAHPEAGFVYGHQLFVSDDGEPIADRPDWAAFFTTCLTGDVYAYALRNGHPLRAPGATRSRRAGGRAGGAHRLERAQDLDLNLRIVRDHPIACNDRIVLRSRIHGGNQVFQYGPGLRGAVQAQRLQRQYVRQNPRYADDYKTGLRLAQRYWGSRLADQIATEARAGKRRAALRSFRLLARYAPVEAARLAARIPRRLRPA
jgi:glycosyltransferase involved in cell wall biosynthesis